MSLIIFIILLVFIACKRSSENSADAASRKRVDDAWALKESRTSHFKEAAYDPALEEDLTNYVEGLDYDELLEIVRPAYLSMPLHSGCEHYFLSDSELTHSSGDYKRKVDDIVDIERAIRSNALTFSLLKHGKVRKHNCEVYGARNLTSISRGVGKATKIEWDMWYEFWAYFQQEIKRYVPEARMLFLRMTVNPKKRSDGVSWERAYDFENTPRYEQGRVVWFHQTTFNEDLSNLVYCSGYKDDNAVFDTSPIVRTPSLFYTADKIPEDRYLHWREEVCDPALEKDLNKRFKFDPGYGTLGKITHQKVVEINNQYNKIQEEVRPTYLSMPLHKDCESFFLSNSELIRHHMDDIYTIEEINSIEARNRNLALHILLAKHGKIPKEVAGRYHFTIAKFAKGVDEATKKEWDLEHEFWVYIQDEIKRHIPEARLLFLCPTVNPAEESYGVHWERAYDHKKAPRYEEGRIVWFHQTMFNDDLSNLVFRDS